MGLSWVVKEPMHIYGDLSTLPQFDHLVGSNYILKERGLANHLNKNDLRVEDLKFKTWDQKDSRIIVWL